MITTLQVGQMMVFTLHLYNALPSDTNGKPERFSLEEVSGDTEAFAVGLPVLLTSEWFDFNTLDRRHSDILLNRAGSAAGRVSVWWYQVRSCPSWTLKLTIPSCLVSKLRFSIPARI